MKTVEQKIAALEAKASKAHAAENDKAEARIDAKIQALRPAPARTAQQEADFRAHVQKIDAERKAGQDRWYAEQQKSKGASVPTAKVGTVGQQSEHQKASGAGGEGSRTMPKQVPIGTDGGRWITMNGRRMFIKG